MGYKIPHLSFLLLLLLRRWSTQSTVSVFQAVLGKIMDPLILPSNYMYSAGGPNVEYRCLENRKGMDGPKMILRFDE